MQDFSEALKPIKNTGIVCLQCQLDDTVCDLYG